MDMTSQDVVEAARLIKELCGVALDETKGYLLESRLARLVEEYRCRDYCQLCQKALSGDRTLRSRIIDAITTQETLFFRDNSPYEALRHKAIPDVIDARSETMFPRRIRIWSAACSTGQEPYSIAMVLSEMLPDIQRWDVSILATDISDSAVRQASLGYYREHEIARGLPPTMLNKYFTRHADGWKVKDSLRSLIHFRQRNLLQPFSDIGPFDIVFCRNVAIYFEPDVRKDLFHRIADRLEPYGYLFVGSSESLADLGPRFTPQYHCRCVCYQPNTAAKQPA